MTKREWIFNTTVLVVLLGMLLFIRQQPGDRTAWFLGVGVVALGWTLFMMRRHEKSDDPLRSRLESQWGSLRGAFQWVGLVLGALSLNALFGWWRGNPLSWYVFQRMFVGFLLIYPTMFILVKLTGRKNTTQESGSGRD